MELHWFTFNAKQFHKQAESHRFLTRKMKDAYVKKYEVRAQLQRNAWVRHVREHVTSEMKSNPKALYDRTKIVRICLRSSRIEFQEEHEGEIYMMAWMVQYWWRNFGKQCTTRRLVQSYLENGLTMDHKFDSYDDLLKMCQSVAVAKSTRSCLLRIIFLCSRTFRYFNSEGFNTHLLYSKLDTKKFMFSFIVYFYPYQDDCERTELSGLLHVSATRLVFNFDFLCRVFAQDSTESPVVILQALMQKRGFPVHVVTPDLLLPMMCNFFENFMNWLNVDLTRKYAMINTAIQDLENVRQTQQYASSETVRESIESQLSNLRDHMNLLSNFPDFKTSMNEEGLSDAKKWELDLFSLHQVSLDKEFRYSDKNLEKYYVSTHLARLDADVFWGNLLREVMNADAFVQLFRDLINAVKGEVMQFRLANFNDFMVFIKDYIDHTQFEISDCVKIVEDFGNLILQNLHGSYHDNASMIWRNAREFTKCGKKILFRCCKVLYMMTRYYCIQQLNAKIELIAPIVTIEGMMIERSVFNEKIKKGYKTPVIDALMKQAVGSMNYNVQDVLALFSSLHCNNVAVQTISCKCFYFFLTSHRYLEHGECFHYPEPFFLDKPKMLEFKSEFLFIQFMIVFVSILVSNAVTYLKRTDFGLCEDDFIQNVIVFKDALRDNILTKLNLEIFSMVNFMSDFCKSECMRSIQECMFDCDLFLDDEIVEILKKSMEEFEEPEMIQRFLKV